MKIINIFKWLLGVLSIACIITVFPLALSNPDLQNQWLIIALAIPNAVVITWFMVEAML